MVFLRQTFCGKVFEKQTQNQNNSNLKPVKRRLRKAVVDYTVIEYNYLNIPLLLIAAKIINLGDMNWSLVCGKTTLTKFEQNFNKKKLIS